MPVEAPEERQGSLSARTVLSADICRRCGRGLLIAYSDTESEYLYCSYCGRGVHREGATSPSEAPGVASAARREAKRAQLAKTRQRAAEARIRALNEKMANLRLGRGE